MIDFFLTTIMSISLVMLLTYIVSAIIGIIYYVATSVAFQRMAKKLNLENDWFVWIPILKTYMIGKIAGDQINVLDYKVDNFALILVVVQGLSMFVGKSNGVLIPSIILLLSLVLFLLAYYNIYNQFTPKYATIYTILTVFIPITSPIILLIASRSDIATNNNKDDFIEDN